MAALSRMQKGSVWKGSLCFALGFEIGNEIQTKLHVLYHCTVLRSTFKDPCYNDTFCMLLPVIKARLTSRNTSQFRILGWEQRNWGTSLCPGKCHPMNNHNMLGSKPQNFRFLLRDLGIIDYCRLPARHCREDGSPFEMLVKRFDCEDPDWLSAKILHACGLDSIRIASSRGETLPNAGNSTGHLTRIFLACEILVKQWPGYRMLPNH